MNCRIYSRISRQFLAQFRRSSCGGRLIRGSCHTARVDSQHDGYLSATLTVCVPLAAWTISRSLGYVDAWGRARPQGSEWPHTDLCCCCNLTPFQHSDRARPSFSDDEIKDNDDSTYQISPILTHITDYKGGDVYDDCAKLTREQFPALFSADLDASDDDFGGSEPAK